MTKTGLRRLRIVLSFVILVVWMGFIFSFSSQDAETSSSTSAQVIDHVATRTDKEYPTYTAAQKRVYIMERQYVVRKTAHFCEYAVLGVLLTVFFSSLSLPARLRVPLSLVSGALYATTDELHQTLSDGRSAQITDVLLDTGGVLAGILLALLAGYLFARWKKKRTQAQT